MLQCIGDYELLTDPNGAYEESIVACTDSMVAEISMRDLELAIGGPLGSANTNDQALRALKRVQLLMTL